MLQQKFNEDSTRFSGISPTLCCHGYISSGDAARMTDEYIILWNRIFEEFRNVKSAGTVIITSVPHRKPNLPSFICVINDYKRRRFYDTKF